MPPKKAFNWGLWIKVLVGGTIISVGGPALTFWLVPTEEELRSRYNPELLKRSLEGREERQQEFDQFVTRLKEYWKPHGCRNKRPQLEETKCGEKLASGNKRVICVASQSLDATHHTRALRNSLSSTPLLCKLQGGNL